MFSWFFQSKKNNDENNFTKAIIDNLINTENIPSNLFRASAYFDVKNYPIPKKPYSPIWFSLYRNDVKGYANTYKVDTENPQNTYDRDTENPKKKIIIVEYIIINPNYKIVNIRNDDNQINKPLMKIIVDYVVDKIRNDENKKKIILDTLKSKKKYNYLIHDEYSQNILSDTEIINRVLNIFKGIYSDNRTNEKILDELLFQEIIKTKINCFKYEEIF